MVERHLAVAHPVRPDVVLPGPGAHGLVTLARDTDQVDIDAGHGIEALQQPLQQGITGRAFSAGEEQHAIACLQTVDLRGRIR